MLEKDAAEASGDSRMPLSSSSLSPSSLLHAPSTCKGPDETAGVALMLDAWDISVVACDGSREQQEAFLLGGGRAIPPPIPCRSCCCCCAGLVGDKGLPLLEKLCPLNAIAAAPAAQLSPPEVWLLRLCLTTARDPAGLAGSTRGDSSGLSRESRERQPPPSAADKGLPGSTLSKAVAPLLLRNDVHDECLLTFPLNLGPAPPSSAAALL